MYIAFVSQQGDQAHQRRGAACDDNLAQQQRLYRVQLPIEQVDQHLLVASIAPRPILVEGYDREWFDTRGEYLSCKAASAAWEFLGEPGLPAGDFPADFDESLIGPKLGYVHRAGLHGFSPWDWKWSLDFADAALKQH